MQTEEAEMAIMLVRENGTTINSNLNVFAGADWFEIVVDSAGGTGEGAVNPEYAEAVELLLARLGARHCNLIAIVLNSRPVADFALHERIIAIDEFAYPVQLANVTDITELRKAIASAGARKLSDSIKGGNPRRRLSLIVTIPDPAVVDAKSMVRLIGARAAV